MSAVFSKRPEGEAPEVWLGEYAPVASGPGARFPARAAKERDFAVIVPIRVLDPPGRRPLEVATLKAP